MVAQTLQLEGKEYILVPREQYEHLELQAQAANLPPFPEADQNGRYPAIEYARISLARKIIQDRVASGLTQRELAERACVRLTTLIRLESGTSSISTSAFDKIDRALQRAARRQRRK